MFLTTMNFLPYIILGLIVGWIVGITLKEKNTSLFIDIFLGVIGAIIGGFIIGAISGFGVPFSKIDLLSLAIALVGSIITVLLAKAIRRLVVRNTTIQ